MIIMTSRKINNWALTTLIDYWNRNFTLHCKAFLWLLIRIQMITVEQKIVIFKVFFLSHINCPKLLKIMKKSQLFFDWFRDYTRIIVEIFTLKEQYQTTFYNISLKILSFLPNYWKLQFEMKITTLKGGRYLKRNIFIINTSFLRQRPSSK